MWWGWSGECGGGGVVSVVGVVWCGGGGVIVV